jgi:hypothetical protein
MINQTKSFKDLYDICNERTDSLKGLIHYKIGQCHILKQYGNSSNLEIGLFFLEKSISNGYNRAIRLLFITRLNQKFGFEKNRPKYFYNQSN